MQAYSLAGAWPTINSIVGLKICHWLNLEVCEYVY